MYGKGKAAPRSAFPCEGLLSMGGSPVNPEPITFHLSTSPNLALARRLCDRITIETADILITSNEILLRVLALDAQVS